MAEKIENHLTEQLCEAIASLKNEKQIANFLEDACTISEYKALAQRFEVARLLDEGVKYEDIVERTGASTATISHLIILPATEMAEMQNTLCMILKQTQLLLLQLKSPTPAQHPQAASSPLITDSTRRLQTYLPLMKT